MRIAMGMLAGGIALTVYSYAVYAGLLWVWNCVCPVRERWREPDRWPAVSITVPAFNEENSIASTLDALLATDYPPERLQVLVVSDASAGPDRRDRARLRGARDRAVAGPQPRR